MDTRVDMIYDIKRKLLTKYRRFGGEIAAANIEFRDDLPYHTAATDGKNIYIDPNYFQSLNEEERLFIIAHEVMHIKFRHMFRLIDKQGQKRDLELWNIATDAITNANLERDGFTIKEGYVNRPEALKYSAEEFYEILVQEKRQKEQEQSKKENQGNKESKDKERENGEQPSHQGGDHSLWEEAFRNQGQQSQKSDGQKQQMTSEKNQKEPKEPITNLDEKSEFEDNRKEKRERFKARSEKAKQNIRTTQEANIELGNIGKSKYEIDWKELLRREVEKTQTVWSQRRSIAENNYAYRLEENDIEDEAQTEIMIDVSGSVKLELVKAFLRQIKPILKQSKLKVGCFNEKFWEFIDIKSVKDIDNFTIPREARGVYARTEDWDLAVRSFTKKREINKIVFTDGYPCPGTMPKDDLKNENVIWLVYGNKDFRPCCGKVINLTQRQIEQLHLVGQSILTAETVR